MLTQFPQLVVQLAQTVKESGNSFTVDLTTHMCTSLEENKMALAFKMEDPIGFSFFVRFFACGSLLSGFFSFSQFLQIAKMIDKVRHIQHLDFKKSYEVIRPPSPCKLDHLKNKRAVFTRKTTKLEVQKKEENEG